MQVHNSVLLKFNTIIALNPLFCGSEVPPGASPQNVDVLCSSALT